MTEPLQAPPRLLETAGAAGDCLRQARLEGSTLPPLAGFMELRERRTKRVQRKLGASVVAVLGLGLGLMLVRGLRPEERAASIIAEPPAASHAVASAAPPTQPLPSVEVPAVAPRVTLPTLRRPSPPRDSARSSALAPSERPVAAAPTQARALSAKACAELTRTGQAEQAISCYAALASGEGLSAELALFEKARLEGKVLRHPSQALETLQSYRQRFPRGSLRGEVMLAQIDWLLATGNDPAAGALVEEALDSGLLQERKAELERLRAKLSKPSAVP